MDQVRAAIFSSLAEGVPDASVLDLFAGTGGLGIEALSRGARSATFVERDRRAAECIRKNLVATRLTGGAEVVCLDADTFLRRFSDGTAARFDFIFADPPYTRDDRKDDFVAQLLASSGLIHALNEGGLFVLEKSPQQSIQLDTNGWQPVRQKRYGSTEVVFLRRAPLASVDAALEGTVS